MELFDDIQRTNQDPKTGSETSFGYLNTSARHAFAKMRALLQAWFDSYPDGESKPQLRAAFRSEAFESAFFELYLHELCRCQGFEVKVHPEMPDKTEKRCDFLVRWNAQSVLYFEATVVGPSREQVAREALVNRVYDTLNELSSPNFFLHVEPNADSPAAAPPGRKLRRELERWLKTLDPDKVAEQDRGHGFDSLPSYPWEHDGWRMTFWAIPKSPKYRGKLGVRPIGSRSTGVVALRTHEKIREAVKDKATRYGELGLPYLIAVNVIDEFGADDIDILNALLGDEAVMFQQTRGGSGFAEAHGRQRDGVWFGPQGPRNTRVSGVLVAVRISPSTMADTSGLTRHPELFHNPWAARPLSPNVWQLRQRICNRAEGRYDERPGDSVATVLGLPDPWPPSGP